MRVKEKKKSERILSKYCVSVCLCVCVCTYAFQSFGANGNLILLYQKDLIKLKEISYTFEVCNCDISSK